VTREDCDWYPWSLGTYWPEGCGGHSYIYHPGQLHDTKKSAEKSRLSGGRLWQVVHRHEPGKRCDGCEVFGTEEEIPKLARATEET
jgi:hypothetical protein